MKGWLFYCKEALGRSGGLQHIMLEEGTLWWLNETTGYGLIRRPLPGRRDLLMRPQDVARNEVCPLEEGDEVSYEVKKNRTRTRATNVSLRVSRRSVDPSGRGSAE